MKLQKIYYKNLIAFPLVCRLEVALNCKNYGTQQRIFSIGGSGA